jgi:drug/metabolite transporter (DMT)-like permease
LIWLLPAALCSIAIAAILKINEVRGGDRVLLAAANYVVAAVIALFMLGGRLSRPAPPTLVLGTIAGIDYVLGFLLLMAGIAGGPLAVPVTVMRLSVVVPIAVSIAVWGELPGAAQWCGIAIGMLAIVLFGWSLSGRSSGDRSGRGYWALILSLFMVMGVGDVLLKAFRELSSGDELLMFIFVLFSTAAVFTWIIVLLRRIQLGRRTLLLGVLLGVSNLYSTVFVLMALRSTPASIAFPFVNLAVILGSSLVGFFVWRERLSRKALLGLILAGAALILIPLR